MKVNLYQMFVNDKRLPYLETVRETDCEDYKTYSSPVKIAELLKEVFCVDRLAEEYVWLLCFDVKFQCVGMFEVSHGGAAQSVVDVSQILKRALLCGADQMILGHNHPSGIVEPSKEDYFITERLHEAGRLLGLPLCDHIIVGGANRNDYFSFRESGVLKE